MVELAEFKARVAERYDPDYLVDVLDLTSAEILDAFEERLNEKRESFDEIEDDSEEQPDV